jgi:prevent-host-death family protein
MSVYTIPISEAKQRFTEIVKATEDYFDRYVVTKNGKESAVVLSAEEYDSLLETLDVLSNKSEIKAIADGATQARIGKTRSLQDYLSSKSLTKKRNDKR